MRAYFFGNMYLSSIQQGIQALHCTSEMFVKYQLPPDDSLMFDVSDHLYDWAREHKTVVLLNAGYSSTIRDIQAFMMDNDNHYPWAVFHEGDDALDGALTCLGIVLPEKIYEAARLVRTFRAGFDNVRTPRQMIWEDGELIIHKENEYGLEVEEDTTWTYNKWEAKLIDELNKYGLAK
jgi:hypothetical protein